MTDLPPPVRAAYDAPFPDAASQAGAKALPLLVPTSDDDPAVAAMWAADIPGCTGLGVLPGAGHFLQEDAGPRIAELVVEHVRRTAPGPG